MTVLRISSVCLGALVSALLASSFAFSQERPVVNGILGPPSPGTCFWTDRAFKDIPERGPAEAAGIVLWSHGQAAGGQRSWHHGAPPVIRMFAEQGWEVVLAQRNERCEGSWTQKGGAYVANLVEEVSRAKRAGYRRVLVAGQSVGAGTALGASARSKEIDGMMAFALSHGRGSCRDPTTFRPERVPFFEEMIRKGIAESIAPRILISMGKDDHCVGMTFTPLVASSLAQKNAAYIHFDESMRQTGHGAAITKDFAATYGACVVEFFVREDAPPKGRHVCAPSSNG